MKVFSLLFLLIAFIQSIRITIGEQLSKNTEIIEITFDTLKLRVLYCAINNKNITKNEFNYPNMELFVILNEEQLLTTISQELLKSLKLQSALIHYQNYRCKQYTIYNYHEDQYFHESQYIQNQLTKQFKKTDDNITQYFKNNNGFQYKQSLQNKQIYSEIIFVEDKIQPQYNISRILIGDGLHQYLQTTITFNNQEQLEGQQIILKDNLDVYSYADKDELDKLELQYYQMTIMDIERPRELSQQHILLSRQLYNKTIQYTYPYHFRYHLAGYQHYQTSYVPIDIEIFLDCSFEQTFSGNCKQLQQNIQNNKALEYSIPTGYLPLKNLVFIITIGLTLGMSIHISKQIVKYSK